MDRIDRLIEDTKRRGKTKSIVSIITLNDNKWLENTSIWNQAKGTTRDIKREWNSLQNALDCITQEINRYGIPNKSVTLIIDDI